MSFFSGEYFFTVLILVLAGAHAPGVSPDGVKKVIVKVLV
jgi:hypothetical protein